MAVGASSLTRKRSIISLQSHNPFHFIFSSLVDYFRIFSFFLEAISPEVDLLGDVFLLGC